MTNEYLRQQLRDVAREALPDLPWEDHVQGAEAMFDGKRLTLFACGFGRFPDPFVQLAFREEDARTFIYFVELQRGYGCNTKQVHGRIVDSGFKGDPQTFLAECLREALTHQDCRSHSSL